MRASYASKLIVKIERGFNSFLLSPQNWKKGTVHSEDFTKARQRKMGSRVASSPQGNVQGLIVVEVLLPPVTLMSRRRHLDLNHCRSHLHTKKLPQKPEFELTYHHDRRELAFGIISGGHHGSQYKFTELLDHTCSFEVDPKTVAGALSQGLLLSGARKPYAEAAGHRHRGWCAWVCSPPGTIVP